MSDCFTFIGSLPAALEVLGDILAKTEEVIIANQFAKRNQPLFIIQSQNQILNSNLTHILTKPTKNLYNKDQEPSNIPLDTYMNVGKTKEQRTSSRTDGVSVKSRSQRHSLKTSKYESIKSNKKSIQFKQTSKKELLEKFTALLTQQNQKEQAEYDRLRQQKLHEQMVRLAERPRQRPQAVCILGKGERVVYDYEGNPSKRKETGLKYLNSSILCSEISQQKPQNKARKNYSQPSSNSPQSKITSTRNQKLKESQQNEKEIVFDLSNKKQAILKSLQIKDAGIKIIVDGETAKVDKAIMEKNSQNSRITQKRKTTQMKKVDLNHNPRFKTEVLPSEKAKSELIPNTLRKGQRAGSHSHASGSSYFSKLDKISVENCFLQKLVLPNEDDVQGKYVELPSYRKRRVKTHLESQSLKSSIDLQGMRIKERLIKMTKNGDKLPKIISQHKQLEQQILKEAKKKCLI